MELEFPLDDALALWLFERLGRKDTAGEIRRALGKWAGFFVRKNPRGSVRRAAEAGKADFPLPFEPDEAVLDAAQVLAGSGREGSPFWIADTQLPWLAGLKVSGGSPRFEFAGATEPDDDAPVYGLRWTIGSARAAAARNGFSLPLPGQRQICPARRPE